MDTKARAAQAVSAGLLALVLSLGFAGTAWADEPADEQLEATLDSEQTVSVEAETSSEETPVEDDTSDEELALADDVVDQTTEGEAPAAEDARDETPAAEPSASDDAAADTPADATDSVRDDADAAADDTAVVSEPDSEPAIDAAPVVSGLKSTKVAAEPVKASRVNAANPAATQTAATASDNYTATKAGWVKLDGKSYYYDKAGDTKPHTGWLVTTTQPNGKTGDSQRYWLGKDGALVTAQLISKADAGYWAYAKSNGQVVRGRWVDSSNGYVYLADDDGKLLGTGWNVTGTFTKGTLQRYWIDKSAHAAIPGVSAEGYIHYTLEKVGYVLRGKKTTDEGTLLADNDGRLAATGSGWMVTSKYDGHLERYYMVNKGNYSLAKTGFFKVGNAEYLGIPNKGYVLRNKTNYNGKLYLADNSGKLATAKTGWMVTNKYDGSLQRYYMVKEGSHAYAKTGLFTVGSAHYYGIPSKGYVVRGKYKIADGMLLATNDGKLVWSTGWKVTNKFDGHLERYYLTKLSNGMIGAKTGLFKLGSKEYYGIPSKGYVLRGYLKYGNGYLHGNNSGVITRSKYGPYESAYRIAKTKGSATNWLILIDNKDCWVYVFHRENGAWEISRAMRCTNGGSKSVRGTFTVGGKGYAFGDSHYTCYYYTQIYRDWLIHSTKYHAGTFRHLDKSLGGHHSAGCVRVAIDNAKWIYDTIPGGTTIYSYN